MIFSSGSESSLSDILSNDEPIRMTDNKGQTTAHESDGDTYQTTKKKGTGRFTPKQNMTTRWTLGAPQNKDYYWDEDLPKHLLKKHDRFDNSLWPPKGMDLSSAWVGVIVLSDLNSQERRHRWPDVFSARYLNRSYLQKGRASKSYQHGALHYDIAFGGFQLHGDEGRLAGLIAELPRPLGADYHRQHLLEKGGRCLVQSFGYTPSPMRTAALSSAGASFSQIPSLVPSQASSAPAKAATSSSKPTPPKSQANPSPQYAASSSKVTAQKAMKLLKEEATSAQVPMAVAAATFLRSMKSLPDYASYFSPNKRDHIESPEAQDRIKRMRQDAEGVDTSKNESQSYNIGKANEIAGTIVLSDDEEEGGVRASHSQELQEMQDRLRKAEQKVVMLTSVLEATHDAAMQLSQAGIQAYKKMASVPTLTEYATEVKEMIKGSTPEMNEAIRILSERFPMTANRVVSHGMNERTELNAWASTSVKDFGRLEHPKGWYPQDQ